MDKKFACSLLAVLILASASISEAQQPGKVYRIGTLDAGSAVGRAYVWDAFRQRLRELGYVEGKNLILEQRWTEGKREQLAGLVEELIRLKVDLIVTASTGPALAAKKATSTIPIVMASQSDPVGTGLVASLARPGGNVTGMSSMNVELGGKRLEVLKDAVPKIARVALLRPVRSPSLQSKEIEAAARALGLQLLIVEMGEAIQRGDYENAFQTMAKQRANALLVSSTPTFFAARKRLAEVAMKNKLPTMYPEGEYANAGGLMAYGIVTTDLFRRAASYVDKILKGTKPADLPVEQAMKFEFIINLKAAKQIGLTIPPEVLARANRVIQ
jgi:putative tryptophan/tyrosine transport system substrate-binding protein